MFSFLGVKKTNIQKSLWVAEGWVHLDNVPNHRLNALKAFIKKDPLLRNICTFDGKSILLTVDTTVPTNLADCFFAKQSNKEALASYTEILNDLKKDYE